MLLLQIITSINIKSGGPSLSTWALVNGLRNHGLDTKVITYMPNTFHDNMIGKGDFVYTLPSPLETRYAYSKLYKNLLKTFQCTLYHGHGLWQYPVHAMVKEAQKKGIPYIISPRGMLYPEALKKSALFKKIALILFQLSDLKNATVIHATSKQEMIFIRKMGIKTPIAVIPNAIDMNIPRIKIKIQKTKFLIVFLVWFDPIKNIETLLEAYVGLEHNNNEIELVLIGDGPDVYRKELEKISKTLKINNIIFTGFLIGDEREIVFRSLSILVLPSKSENFGMVVPEALIREIPVIASKATPWEELEIHKCGWWVDNGVKPLKQALKEASALNTEELKKMGKNGKKLIEEKYSTEKVTDKMIELYEWILGKRKKPKFVNIT